MREHLEETRRWLVAYDPRGHLREPHGGAALGLGTLEVGRYLASWQRSGDSGKETRGPRYRYGAALFVEKEGFQAILDAARIAERFDLAIMSTKGYSSTAARDLVAALTDVGVPVLALHDFDADGFGIAHTLRNDTDRYQFESEPNVVDLGLRLADVRVLRLESEPVTYGKSDPCPLLYDRGASEAEVLFLCRGTDASGHYVGDRCELERDDLATVRRVVGGETDRARRHEGRARCDGARREIVRWPATAWLRRRDKQPTTRSIWPAWLFRTISVRRCGHCSRTSRRSRGRVPLQPLSQRPPITDDEASDEASAALEPCHPK